LTEISNASLFFNNKFVIELDYPKLKSVEGEILIDCYLIDKNHGYENDSIHYEKLQEKLNGSSLEIRATTKQGSKIIFNQIYLNSCSYPSFEFTFICLDHSIEYILCNENKNIENFHLSSLIVEGFELEFTKTSKINRKRNMFGIDDSRTLSIHLDNSELYFEYFNKKRFYNLKIGIIENTEDTKSVILKFFGDNLIPYRIYKLFKYSIKYFLSYIAGNNVIIREENFTINHSYYISKIYSAKNLSEFKKNTFLPIFDVQFRHEGILQDYINTFSEYLFLEKSLNLSEVIYLVNQSKQVNIESSFFILLIAIEKLSNNLIKSKLIKSNNNFVIDNEIFKELKSDLFKKIDEDFTTKINKKAINSFKTKIGNLNLKNKTDNKIDLLLDFCEISRNDEIDLLFPKLRNLAIHEGEISLSENDVYKNYQTLFVLINSMICNLLQYKGIRFLEHVDSTNYISKKEKFKIDYNNYS